ncbi:MAG: GNAT family N-acetyltransferase [Haloarculaceae archaeon]
MEIQRIGFDAWGDALPSSGFEVFHLPAALRVLDDHADGECRLYAARKGQHTIGLLPVFVAERPVGRTAFSPPPGFSIPRLGPLLMPNSPKRSKRERLNRELVSTVLSDVDADAATTLFRMTTPLSYADPRPLSWNDLSVQPQFTYVVDLSEHDDMESLLAGFSKSLRREMREIEDLDLTIADEGLDGARQIHREVVERLAEQGETPPASRSFAEDIFEALGDRARAYVARDPDGRYLGGVVTLFSNDLAYYWLGGVRSSYENVSVNTLVHRRVMADILEDPELESVWGYDLVGANTERLCEYKAKFAGDLEPYYAAESSGVGMSAAKAAYQMVNGSLTKG